MSSEDVSQNMEVFETTDYKQFKLEKANRPVNEYRARRLAEAIERDNQLQEFPIKVTAKMTVMDGQHRLAAAQQLGVPVYYQYTKMTIEDAREAVRYSARWSKRDFLHHYCEKGIKAYAALKVYLDKYPFINIDQVLAWCPQPSNALLVREAFEMGQFEFTGLGFANKVAKAVLDFEPYFQYWKQRFFVVAIARLLESPKYDHERMVKKVADLQSMLIKSPDANAYILNLEEIYNYQLAKKNKVTFRDLLG